MMFYLYGEDLVAGLVGPFKTREAAEAHAAFWRERGDASYYNNSLRTLTLAEAQSTECWLYNRVTPEEDLKLVDK